MANSCRSIHGHKYTAKCPKCKYSSKIPFTDDKLTNKNSTHSKVCPKHRLVLVRVLGKMSKK